MALYTFDGTWNEDEEAPDKHTNAVRFRGVHSDVGGGNGNVRRNNISLAWMLQQARAAGLPVSAAYVDLVGAETDRLASISQELRSEARPQEAHQGRRPSRCRGSTRTWSDMRTRYGNNSGLVAATVERLA